MPSVEKYAKANIGLMVVLLIAGGGAFGFALVNALAPPRSILRLAFSGISTAWIIVASIVGFVASGRKTRKIILTHFWLLFLLSVWILATYIAYISLVYNDTEGAKQACLDANITNLFQCNSIRMRNHGIFGGISVVVLAGTLTLSIVSACWWRAAKYEQWDKIAEREEKKQLAINSDQGLKSTAAKKSESENNEESDVESESDSSSSASDSSEEDDEESIDESARLESSKEMN